MDIRNIAVVLAGGVGSRLASGEVSLPKQFIEINGKPMIVHTTQQFQNSVSIDDIVIVVHKDYINLVNRLVDNYKLDKVIDVVAGGESRSSSSIAGLERLSTFNSRSKVLLHDAARPLVSTSVIKETVQMLDIHEAVVVASNAVDTLLRVDGRSMIMDVPPRDSFYHAQTPQAFRLDVISDAYSRAVKDINFIATDDSGVVQKYSSDINQYVVEGGRENIKVTYPSDLRMASLLLNERED